MHKLGFSIFGYLGVLESIKEGSEVHLGYKFQEELEKLIQRIVQDEIDSRVGFEGETPKGEIRDKDEERKKNRVRTELIRKGYFLEIQVYKKLIERGWLTELNANFWDVETNPEIRPWEEVHKDNRKYNLEKKTRTIDIIALKNISSGFTGNYSDILTKLVIECKYSGRQNWAFFLETGYDLIQRYNSDMTGPVGLWGTISYLDSLLLEQSCSGVDSVQHLPGCDVREDARENLTIIGKLNWASHLSPRILKTAATAGVTLFGNEDSMYNATLQVLDAAIHQKAFREIFMFDNRAKRRTLFEYWRIYPIIVFDGPIWSYTIESGNLEVRPIDWITLYTKRKDHEYAVDIVSMDSIDSYLDMINEELESLKSGGIDPYPELTTLDDDKELEMN